MEDHDVLYKQHRMLNYLRYLPRKILASHGRDHINECVLHDLCHERCFNLTKAAYFIDNPDFNCTKGVAGFLRDQECGASCSLWDNAEQRMQNHEQFSVFNSKVRSINKCSLMNVADAHAQLAQEIAQELDFNNYAFCSWNSKHGNQGFVIYQKATPQETFADDYLVDGLSLLSFCPIH